MSDNPLSGKVTIPKLLLDSDCLNGEPATKKTALIDLWTWANDRPRQFTVGANKTVSLKRGQLAYSQATLSKIWRWTREKVACVLSDLQNNGLITYETGNATTIITVLDYDIYNSDTTPEPAADTTAETTAELTANLTQKVEGRRLKVEGGREIPSEQMVRDFCVGYRNLSCGIESGIPEVWWSSWMADRLCRNSWPDRWQDALVLAHRSDWMNPRSPGHAKAHGSFAAKPDAGSGNGKNGGGESAAQRLFKLDKRIEELGLQIVGFETTQPELADRLQVEQNGLLAEREVLR